MPRISPVGANFQAPSPGSHKIHGTKTAHPPKLAQPCGHENQLHSFLAPCRASGQDGPTAFSRSFQRISTSKTQQPHYQVATGHKKLFLLHISPQSSTPSPQYSTDFRGILHTISTHLHIVSTSKIHPHPNQQAIKLGYSLNNQHLKRISIVTLPGADLLTHRHKAGAGLLKLLFKNGGKTEKVITLSAPNQSQITKICRLMNDGEENEATRFLMTSCFMPTWSDPHYPPTKRDIEPVMASSVCSAYIEAAIQMVQGNEEDFPVVVTIDL